jgi:putative membrane protein
MVGIVIAVMRATDQLKETNCVVAQDETKPLALDTSTRLAFERTRVSYDGNMLAWTRTATSLISFGFSIYKFFQLDLGSRRPDTHTIGAREFGLIMVVIGLFAIIQATFEHRKNMRSLREYGLDIPTSRAGLLGALISLLGILALVVMIFRA